MFNINITHIKKKETPYKDEVGLTILLSEGLHIKKGGRGIDNPKGKIYRNNQTILINVNLGSNPNNS